MMLANFSCDMAACNPMLVGAWCVARRGWVQICTCCFLSRTYRCCISISRAARAPGARLTPGLLRHGADLVLLET